MYQDSQTFELARVASTRETWGSKMRKFQSRISAEIVFIRQSVEADLLDRSTTGGSLSPSRSLSRMGSTMDHGAAKTGRLARVRSMERSRTPWVDSAAFISLMSLVSLISTIIVGVQIDVEGLDDSALGWTIVDNVLLLLYMAESGGRIYFHPYTCWFDAFNLLDFTLTIMGILEVWAQIGPKTVSALRALRVLRAARLVRYIRFFPTLQVATSGVKSAFVLLCWVVPILGGVTWIFGLFLKMSLGETAAWLFVHRDQDDLVLFQYFDSEEYFGSTSGSAWTLFQQMTLESFFHHVWRPVIEIYPFMSLFFILFNCVTTYSLCNILLGIQVNHAIQSSQASAKLDEAYEQHVRSALVKKLNEFFIAVDTDESETLTAAEIQEALRDPKLAKAFEELQMPVEEVTQLFWVLDRDRNGELTRFEFVRGVERLVGNPGPRDIVKLDLRVRTCVRKAQLFELRMRRLLEGSQLLSECVQIIRLHMADTLRSWPRQRAPSPGRTEEHGGLDLGPGVAAIDAGTVMMLRKVNALVAPAPSKDEAYVPPPPSLPANPPPHPPRRRGQTAAPRRPGRGGARAPPPLPPAPPAPPLSPKASRGVTFDSPPPPVLPSAVSDVPQLEPPMLPVGRGRRRPIRRNGL
mmetsp:Transcript_72552/g.193467  ORF Transcript_72552/g.193467 Transcript_72552/m.193467 type:complete len:635 (-) Transcript_72552:64-1968(-)